MTEIVPPTIPSVFSFACYPHLRRDQRYSLFFVSSFSLDNLIVSMIQQHYSAEFLLLICTMLFINWRLFAAVLSVSAQAKSDRITQVNQRGCFKGQCNWHHIERWTSHWHSTSVPVDWILHCLRYGVPRIESHGSAWCLTQLTIFLDPPHCTHTSARPRYFNCPSRPAPNTFAFIFASSVVVIR